MWRTKPPHPPTHPVIAVFDMGAAATAERAEACESQDGGVAGAFGATREGLLPRPWVSEAVCVCVWGGKWHFDATI